MECVERRRRVDLHFGERAPFGARRTFNMVVGFRASLVKAFGMLEAGQYGRALLPYGVQAAGIESEDLEDRRRNLRRLDEGCDSPRLE